MPKGIREGLLAYDITCKGFSHAFSIQPNMHKFAYVPDLAQYMLKMLMLVFTGILCSVLLNCVDLHITSVMFMYICCWLSSLSFLYLALHG